MQKRKTKAATKTLRTWWVVEVISRRGQRYPMSCHSEKSEAFQLAEGMDRRVIGVRESSAARGDGSPTAWVIEKQRESGTWYTAGIAEDNVANQREDMVGADLLDLFLAAGVQKHRFTPVVPA